MRWLFLIFIVMPVVEMLVLIEVGIRLGSVLTVALIFINAIIGIILLRRQGLKTLLSFNQKLNRGELPAQEVLSAVFLAFAAILLLVPGFVTDVVGFLLLVPFVRTRLADYLIKQGTLKAVNSFQQSQFYQYVENFSSANEQDGNSQDDNAQDDIDYAVFKAKKAAEKNAERFENSEFILLDASLEENFPLASGDNLKHESEQDSQNSPSKKE